MSKADPFRTGAMHHARCGEARTRDGLRRQKLEVRGLRERFCFHSWGATFLSRQTIQKRPEALQELQGKARIGIRRGSLRDANRLFGMRDGDYCAVQADAGAPRPLQAVLSAKEDAAGELARRSSPLSFSESRKWRLSPSTRAMRVFPPALSAHQAQFAVSNFAGSAASVFILPK
jgi:hypothetical protein